MRGMMMMAIAEPVQAVRDATLALLAKVDLDVQSLLTRSTAMRPEKAREVGALVTALMREVNCLIQRARTDQECIVVMRTISPMLRELADDAERSLRR
jgi:hypothetical protein